MTHIGWLEPVHVMRTSEWISTVVITNVEHDLQSCNELQGLNFGT